MGGTQTHIKMVQDCVRKPSETISNFISIPKKFSTKHSKCTKKQVNVFIDVQFPYSHSINIKEQTFFNNSNDLFQTKNQFLNDFQIIRDNMYFDKYIIHAQRQNKPISFVIKPFKAYDSYIFSQIAQQVQILQDIGSLKCNHLHKIQDKYVVSLNLPIPLPNSQIIQLQGFTCTLDQIIRYRQINKQQWLVSEFYTLYSNLYEAVTTLNNSGYYHNDIRPINVLLSLSRQLYLLSGFQLASRVQQLHQVIQPQTCMRAGTLNCRKNDAFGLGMTLACAFLYTSKIAVQQALQRLQKQVKYYPFVQHIIIMLTQKRIPDISYDNKQPQFPSKDTIQSLIWKDRQVEDSPITLDLKCEAFMRLGLSALWKKQLISNLQQSEHIKSQYDQAVVQNQLAMAYKSCGEISSKHNIQKYQINIGVDASKHSRIACNSFKKIGQGLIDEDRFDEAERILKQALQCKHNMQLECCDDTIQCYVLLAQNFCQKGQYDTSKQYVKEALQQAARFHGRNSEQFWQIKLEQARIDEQFTELQQAKKNLNQVRNDLINPSGKIEAQLLMREASLQLSEANQMSNQEQRKEIVNNVRAKLKQAIQKNIKVAQNRDLAMAEITELTGRSYLATKQYGQAKRSFEKTIQLRKMHLQQDPKNLKTIKLNAETISLLASCAANIQDNDVALKLYEQVLQTYKQIYGSHQNQHSALVIGNMSKAYYNQGKTQRACQRLNLAISILEKIASSDDPYYQIFSSALNKISNQKK